MTERTHACRSGSGWTRVKSGAYKTANMETVIRLLILGVLVAIVASLGSALFHLSRKTGDPRKMARSLTLRVALSVALFILLMIAWHLGLIAPHGLGRHP
jgi:cytochrome bd-type quinol oxidase subunit 2